MLRVPGGGSVQRHRGRLRRIDRLDTQQAAPLRLVAEAVLECALRVLLAEVHVDCFGIAGLDQCVQAHRDDRMRLAAADQEDGRSRPTDTAAALALAVQGAAVLDSGRSVYEGHGVLAV